MSARHDEYRVDWRADHPGRPVAEAGNRFAELGHKIMASPWVLLPLGLMCLWALLDSAGMFGP